MITFLRTKYLAEQLKNNSVPEFHKFLYLTIPVIAEMILWVGTKFLTGNDYDEGSPSYRKLFIYVVGMAAMWIINSRRDNQNFIDRFVCLSFPAYVKVNLLGFAYSFVTILWHQMNLDLETRQLIGSVFFFLNEVLFYILVGYWMKYISSGKSQKL